MSTVDFLEIPKANIGDGNQDTFELFARDFIEDLGFKIVQEPGRGSDAGRDIIVEERRTGVGGETVVRWLVSCKHYAHSGRSVGVEDETNIFDRVQAANAKGFLPFYSTIPSSTLVTRLQELSPSFENNIFDRAKIEKHLLKLDSGNHLFSRYFPVSYQKWSVAHPRKPKLYFSEEALLCEYCSKDLLQSEEKVGMSMFVMWEDNKTLKVDSVYWCCKGHCDEMLRQKYSTPHNIDRWDELGDYTHPTYYVIAISRYIDSVNRGNCFTNEAFAKFRKLLIITFHQVARELTPREEEMVKLDIEIGFI